MESSVDRERQVCASRPGRTRVLIAILLAAAVMGPLEGPVQAAFDVPDSCRAGRGTYNGQLTGEASYSTCIVGGVEKISIRFAGDFARTADYQNTPAIIYSERTLSDAGEITNDSNAGRKRVKFTAQFGTCGITGSWQLLNSTTGDVELTGTLDIPSTGSGTLCDPNANGSGGGGGGSGGGTCGLFGSGGLFMAAPAFLLGLRRARIRRPATHRTR